MPDKYAPQRLTRDIVLKNVPMTVSFTYYPGWEADEFDPGNDGELDILSVHIDEFDCYHLMGSKTLVEIEQKLFDILEEGER